MHLFIQLFQCFLKLVTIKLAVRDPKSFSCYHDKKCFVLCFDLLCVIIEVLYYVSYWSFNSLCCTKARQWSYNECKQSSYKLGGRCTTLWNDECSLCVTDSRPGHDRASMNPSLGVTGKPRATKRWMTQFMLLPPLFWPRVKIRAQSQTLISSYDLVHFPLQGATPPVHYFPS